MEKQREKMKTRQPAVAGKFYPGTETALTEQIRNILSEEVPKIDTSLSEMNIIGGVVPHAGYMFSGYEAVHFFDILSRSKEQYETIVILNPNHSGMGEPIALDSNEYWQSPMGPVELDRDFMEKLPFPKSGIAHQYEHSAEVMLPFLQFFLDYKFKIVPVCIASQNYTSARNIAEALFKANSELKKKIVIIASSDFSHYVHPAEGKRKDDLVLDEILKMNSEQLHIVVKKHNISVCGYGPIMTLMEYARLVSDTPEIKVIRRGHSGEIVPSSEVVDYITILFYTDQ